MTDYLILGGGAAGCVLAARLSEDARNKVVLVEAGRNITLDTMRTRYRGAGASAPRLAAAIRDLAASYARICAVPGVATRMR